MHDHDSLELLEQHLTTNYPGGVLRKDIGKATGGLLYPGTCRNHDSLGTGIKGRRLVGRNTVYPIAGIIEYIKSITKECEKE